MRFRLWGATAVLLLLVLFASCSDSRTGLSFVLSCGERIKAEASADGENCYDLFLPAGETVAAAANQKTIFVDGASLTDTYLRFAQTERVRAQQARAYPCIMEKMFYTIGEVAEILGESTSLVRFWSNSFPTFIKPERNAKGNRKFTPEDVDTLKQIHLRESRRTVDSRTKALDSLKEIRRQLAEVKKAL